MSEVVRVSGGPTSHEPDTRPEGWRRPLAQGPEDVRALHQMCREGRLYDVEGWIAEAKPLQLAPEAILKGTRPKTALQMAIGSGQHSLAFLLLRSGYRLEFERYAPLDMALQARRWDLVDLLLEWGVELKSADVYAVLDTYNVELYERFRAAGCDLTERHEMASMLGHGTTNRPLLGFVKRHRTEDPKIQQELNIALGYHVRAGNERGINLCLWAGADAHAPAPNPEHGRYTWEYDRFLRDQRRKGAAPSVDLWPAVRRITVPTLIVRGSESDVFSPETAKRMLDLIPGSQLQGISGAGHSVPAEAPEAFERVVRQFLGA